MVPDAPRPPRGLISLVPDSYHGVVYAECWILDHGRAEIGGERDVGVVCLVLHNNLTKDPDKITFTVGTQTAYSKTG